MSMYRELLVLTKDIKNRDTRARTGANRGMPDEFYEDEYFVHVVIIPERSHQQHNEYVISFDDDDMPEFLFEKDTPVYRDVLAASRRAKPGIARLLHEYGSYTPEDVSGVMYKLVESGAITLAQLEQAIMQYRRSLDYDMLDEPDTIMLPKAGRSKLDADSGRTDPRQDNFDPDMDGYVDPKQAPESDDDGLESPRDNPDDRETEKPQAKKSKKSKKPKKAPARKALCALADKVYEALCQTPGKTRRLTTLCAMVGVKADRDVYQAMDLLSQQGRIDDKGRAVIKED